MKVRTPAEVESEIEWLTGEIEHLVAALEDAENELEESDGRD